MTYEFGDVVLGEIPFADIDETKTRPAVVLFEELGNVTIMGITSNPHMKGIALKKSDGAALDSVIKTNNIYTLSSDRVKKKLFRISESKKNEICMSLMNQMGCSQR
ncbi:MAG: type II toxin-antitoxin system PemK/MazF family toxin [Candidatus Micrarchaeota archaeon]|nr:type II toxin-antitoxin system PemK/MazF family toxin [Candidatus Micrarchaeota archaeon]